jgi:membrane-bound inhibitor of C-type lysozyme
MADEENSDVNPPGSKSKKIIGIAVILIIALIVIGGAIYFLNNRSSLDDGVMENETADVIEDDSVIEEDQVVQDLESTSFVCADNKTINAEFNDANDIVTLNLSDDGELVLARSASGSGTRYINRDETIIFWNQGESSYLEEDGVETYTNCEQV